MTADGMGVVERGARQTEKAPTDPKVIRAELRDLVEHGAAPDALVLARNAIADVGRRLRGFGQAVAAVYEALGRPEYAAVALTSYEFPAPSRMGPVVLEYEDDEFASKAVKLIREGRAFFFEVRGEAFSLLRPRIRDGKFVDPGTFVVVPQLRGLSGVVQFAPLRGMQYRLEAHEDMIGVWIQVNDA